MLKGIGIDIIEIERIRASVEKYGDAFVKKIFTENEIAYCRGRKIYKFPELAVRFAAKEAYGKALGTGINGIHWQQIEVVNDPKGKPQLKVRGKFDKKAFISLSHSRHYAVASVYVEK